MKKSTLQIAAFILICLLLMFADSFAQDKVKCEALNKAGTQCGAYPQKDSKFCFTHNPNVNRCGVITKAGNGCKLPVKETGLKCHLHKSENK